MADLSEFYGNIARLASEAVEFLRQLLGCRRELCPVCGSG